MPGLRPRAAFRSIPNSALVLVGLALVGFTGGAASAQLTGETTAATGPESLAPPAIHQAGLTVSDTPDALATMSARSTTPATSTAPMSSESLSSSTKSSAQPATAAAPARQAPTHIPAAPAPRYVPAPAPAPYRPAPAPAPAPAPRPPVIQIPDFTLTRAPVVPQQPIQIQELHIG